MSTKKRVQIRVEDGTATLRTRNGHDYSSTFPELARVARGFDARGTTA